MRGRKAGCLLAGAGLAMGLAGCSGGGLGSTGGGSTGGGSTTVEPTSVIFVATPPTSLAIDASATLDAAAIYPQDSGSGENTAVTYSVSCASAGGCGTLSPSDEGGAIDYTAPSAVPSGATVTVTATSVADTKLSVSTTITITPPLPIAVTFFATPPASMQVGSTFLLSAGITNDVSANPQVTWSVSCAAPACGSFSATTTTSEQQTTYTAPAAVPAEGNVTVTVTSVTDPTKSASTQIAIVPAGPNLANGTYVFQLSGAGGYTSSFVTGVFTAQNGTVTGGEQDSVYYESDANDFTNAYTDFEPITGGSYGTTYDGNLQITLNATNAGVETLNGTPSANGQGFVAAVDGSPMSATLDLQTSTAAPSGGFALQLTGGDGYQQSAWIGGILNFDSAGAISGAGSVLDVVDGTYTTADTEGTENAVGSSTVSAPDAFGRVVIQLEPGNGSTLPPVYLAAYTIDAKQMRLIETEDQIGNNFEGALGGTALGQGANTGQFTAASVAGTSYVFGAQGPDEKGTLQMAGLFTLGAGGDLPGTLSWNDLSGSAAGQTPVSFTGSYTVDATGRATLTNVQNGAGGTYTIHAYLTGDGNGFVLSSDQDDVFTGQIFEQQAGTFGAGSFSGNYGLSATEFATDQAIEELDPGPVIGPLTVTAASDADTVSGFADNGNGAADFAIAGSVTPAANGVFAGTLAGFTPKDRGSANEFTVYLVDGTQGVLIETDNAQLTLGRVVE